MVQGHKKTSRRNSEKFLVKLSKIGRSTFFNLFSKKVYNQSICYYNKNSKDSRYGDSYHIPRSYRGKI